MCCHYSKAIARVHLVHLTNVKQCQVANATDPWTKITDPGHESACRLLVSTPSTATLRYNHTECASASACIWLTAKLHAWQCLVWVGQCRHLANATDLFAGPLNYWPVGGSELQSCFSHLWTKVHLIKFACVGVFVVCNAVFRLTMSCCILRNSRSSHKDVWNRAEISCYGQPNFGGRGHTKCLAEFHKSGSPLNMWQSLVTIGQATSEIRQRKKKDLHISSKTEWPVLTIVTAAITSLQAWCEQDQADLTGCRIVASMVTKWSSRTLHQPADISWLE